MRGPTPADRSCTAQHMPTALRQGEARTESAKVWWRKLSRNVGHEQ